MVCFVSDKIRTAREGQITTEKMEKKSEQTESTTMNAAERRAELLKFLPDHMKIRGVIV